jgi:hypothetical protein
MSVKPARSPLSKKLLAQVAENKLQDLLTIWLRHADQDYDEACIRLAKRYGLKAYEAPLFRPNGRRE